MLDGVLFCVGARCVLMCAGIKTVRNDQKQGLNFDAFQSQDTRHKSALLAGVLQAPISLRIRGMIMTVRAR